MPAAQAGSRLGWPLPHPSGRTRTQRGHRCPRGSRRIKADSSNSSSKEPWPSVGTGCTWAWGSLGGRAEAPWREARAWQHRVCGGLDQALPARREQCREGRRALQGRRGLGAARGLIHGTHTAPPAAPRGPQLGAGPYPASCSGDGGITVARWPGWQSSQRGYSPSGTQEAPGIALRGGRIQPLDPGAGAMALLMHAPPHRIVPSMLGLSGPGSLGHSRAGLGPRSASHLPVPPGLLAPPSRSQAKAQQLDFSFCDSM